MPYRPSLRQRAWWWWTRVLDRVQIRRVDRALDRAWRGRDSEFVRAMEARDVPRMREMIAKDLRVFMSTRAARRFVDGQLRARGFTEEQIAEVLRDLRPN